MPNQKTPLQLYHHKIAQHEIKPDPEQEKVVQVLDQLHYALTAYQKAASQKSVLQHLGFGKTPATPKGVYIYGGVGRGKSMVMDLFYAATPATLKRRVHFHVFMLELHRFMHEYRQHQKNAGTVDRALDEFADRVAAQSPLLCFDEFHVTDVADAMILSRLFTALFARNVIMVATSNWAPDDLYKNGLQRDLFLPFIALLKDRLTIVHVTAGQDYRLARLRGMPVYYELMNAETEARLQHAFADLVQDHRVGAVQLNVQGRILTVDKAAAGVAWLTFADACREAVGAADYLAMAAAFDVVFLTDVPVLTAEQRNEAKRLMTLIDILYENKVKLVISAAAPPEKIYAAGLHAYEFERSVSRLMEMQSASYLATVKHG